MIKRFLFATLLATAAMSAMSTNPAARAATVDFEDVSLSGGTFVGPTGNAVTVPGPFGPSADGTFASRGVQFSNHYDLGSGTTSGFSVSSLTDTSQSGFAHPYVAAAGSGAGGSANYAVAFGYIDQKANNFQQDDFDPTDPAQRYTLPNIQLPAGFKIASAQVTNNTYAAVSMLDGDGYGKQFGGPTGNDPDWFKVMAYGVDASGKLLPKVPEFYLADYRFANNAQDYILTSWATWDLSALAGATQIYFNVSSSDIGDNGMKTPGYFAMDNIVIVPVPEPSSLVLALAAAAVLSVASRRLRFISSRKESN